MKVKVDECKVMVIMELSEAITVHIPQEAVTTWFESHCESANIVSALVGLKRETEFWGLWKKGIYGQSKTYKATTVHPWCTHSLRATQAGKAYPVVTGTGWQPVEENLSKQSFFSLRGQKGSW